MTAPEELDQSKLKTLVIFTNLQVGGIADEKSQFSEEQLVFALRQAQTGTRGETG